MALSREVANGVASITTEVWMCMASCKTTASSGRRKTRRPYVVLRNSFQDERLLYEATPPHPPVPDTLLLVWML